MKFFDKSFKKFDSNEVIFKLLYRIIHENLLYHVSFSGRELTEKKSELDVIMCKNLR